MTFIRVYIIYVFLVSSLFSTSPIADILRRYKEKGGLQEAMPVLIEHIERRADDWVAHQYVAEGFQGIGRKLATAALDETQALGRVVALSESAERAFEASHGRSEVSDHAMPRTIVLRHLGDALLRLAKSWRRGPSTGYLR